MPIFSAKSEAVALELHNRGAIAQASAIEIKSPPAAAPLVNAGILDKAVRRRGRGGSQITVYWLTPRYGREFVAGLQGHRCKYCRCSSLNPCRGGCAWISLEPPVCDAPSCVRAHQRHCAEIRRRRRTHPKQPRRA